MEELFKVISKKFQNLIQDLSREEVDRMMYTLKKEKGIEKFPYFSQESKYRNLSN